jgi:hypothetical protein
MPTAETQPVQRKSADVRKELLAHTVENEVARGSRVESQSDFQAVLVRGRRPNLVERLIVKIALLGLVFLIRAIRKPGGMWGVVGILAYIFVGQKRSLATVDEYGNTGIQRL